MVIVYCMINIFTYSASPGSSTLLMQTEQLLYTGFLGQRRYDNPGAIV